MLIGGRTTYDANLAALDAIMAEWSGTGTYAQRVAHLTGSPGGLNGTTYLIKGTTVLDDNKIGDTLTVVGWRARDDSPFALGREVTLPGGKHLFFGPLAGTGEGAAVAPGN